jgi:hypothetical protein
MGKIVINIELIRRINRGRFKNHHNKMGIYTWNRPRRQWGLKAKARDPARNIENWWAKKNTILRNPSLRSGRNKVQVIKRRLNLHWCFWQENVQWKGTGVWLLGWRNWLQTQCCESHASKLTAEQVRFWTGTWTKLNKSGKSWGQGK